MSVTIAIVTARDLRRMTDLERASVFDPDLVWQVRFPRTLRRRVQKRWAKRPENWVDLRCGDA